MISLLYRRQVNRTLTQHHRTLLASQYSELLSQKGLHDHLSDCLLLLTVHDQKLLLWPAAEPEGNWLTHWEMAGT